MYRICRIVRALKRKCHIKENHKCVHRMIILIEKNIMRVGYVNVYKCFFVLSCAEGQYFQQNCLVKIFFNSN